MNMSEDPKFLDYESYLLKAAMTAEMEGNMASCEALLEQYYASVKSRAEKESKEKLKINEVT
jgi:hypothetical protein